MEPKMIKKQEVELDLITLKTTKLPYSFKQGDTNVHEIRLKLNVEEGFEYERAQVHYSNGDYQDIEGLTFIIKNSALKPGVRSFEVEFVSGEEIRRSGKVEYRVDGSINSTVEAYDKYDELKKLYDVYVDAADNEEKREQVRIELENLVADIQTKLDDGDFVGEKGEQGPKGDTGEQGPKGDTGEVTQEEFDNLSQEVTAHVEDYATLVDDVAENKFNMNRELISRRNRKPMITIIDDDGRTDVLTKWGTIFQDKNFKLDIGVITNSVGNENYLTWEQLEQFKKDYDVDLVNHTHTHPHLAELTEAELRQEFINSTEILKSRGHSYDIMVLPYGSQNALVRQVTREYCRAGIHTGGGINIPPLKTFRLNRQSLMFSGTPMGTIENYTVFIDQAIAENGWIIFMTHSHYPEFDVEKIKAIIDYANSKNIEWVHVKEGLDKIGNIVDTGDYEGRATGAEYTILDADGILHSKSNSKDYTFMSSLDFKPTINTPLTDYPKGLSSCVIQEEEVAGFPISTGLLETFNAGGTSGALVFNYQLYHPYYTNKIYKRTWNRKSQVWSEFELILTQSDFDEQMTYNVINTVNAYGADAPITNYPNRKITTHAVNSDGGVGFPGNSAGLVTTYRVYSTNWNKQEFRKYKSNEVWSRWSDKGVWQPWEKISAI